MGPPLGPNVGPIHPRIEVHNVAAGGRAELPARTIGTFSRESSVRRRTTLMFLRS